jgi:hypothetical protein
VKKYKGTGSSGKAVYRLFCSECGSPIAHDPDAAPDIIAMKAGTFDSEIKKQLKPVSLTDCLPACGSQGKGRRGKKPANVRPLSQDTEIWTVGKLPFCQEHLAHPFEHMPE